MKEYIVPMTFTISGEAFVHAESPEEAEDLCEAGQWDDHDLSTGSASDWRVIGTPKENI